jgi:glycosyltransferase involved in cell wall biosynthesis
MNPFKHSSLREAPAVSQVRDPKNALTLNGTAPRNKSIPSNYPIIVHSHLRWDWVWQRPQQFLSRLAARHRILFVEGPQVVEGDIKPCFKFREELEGRLIVMHTVFPAARFNDGAWVDSERRRLLKEALSGPLRGKFDQPVQWFYDPMAVAAHVGYFNEIATVYDCMDELSQFKFAPPELIKRERELLDKADVVFAGGRKMWESKSRFNSNCHFYGCGVDIEHFGTARDPKTRWPADVADIEGPVLGYFGVVDERLDYDLIGRLAKANPNWTVVIVGPVCKVDAAQFPQEPNLRWMGGRDYSELPAYTKRFDVCLMPFALNEATEYINPTKALEYMAAGKPIVSTPVSDVVRNFGSVVQLAYNADEFIAACTTMLSVPQNAVIGRGLQMAADNTWDAIVAKLEGHIADALTAKEKVVRASEKSEEAMRPAKSLVPAMTALPVGK